MGAHGHAHHHDEGVISHRWRGATSAERTLIATVVTGIVVTLVALVALWPGGRSAFEDPALLGADPVDARVQATELGVCAYDAALDCVTATVSVTSGINAGEVFTLEYEASDVGRQLTAGDDILVLADELPDGSRAYTFFEYERGTAMWWLLLIFMGVIVAFGRWRGVGALAGLAVSLVVLVGFMLPSLLDGHHAVAVALASTAVIAIVALYLAHGIHPTTSIALVSSFAALAITGALSWLFIHLADFTGFTDDATQLLGALSVPIDPRGVLLAGVVVGSLGVLDDVTVTQVSAVAELHRSRPDLPAGELYRRALHIGRDHISSTVNTLFLAYAGASLPLLLLFTQAGESMGSIVVRELVAVEVVRALVGSIGLVSAVPISTWLASRTLTAIDGAREGGTGRSAARRATS